MQVLGTLRREFRRHRSHPMDKAAINISPCVSKGSEEFDNTLRDKAVSCEVRIHSLLSKIDQ